MWDGRLHIRDQLANVAAKIGSWHPLLATVRPLHERFLAASAELKEKPVFVGMVNGCDGLNEKTLALHRFLTFPHCLYTHYIKRILKSQE